jgi:thiol-disulfide isomerase/thioredoxin
MNMRFLIFLILLLLSSVSQAARITGSFSPSDTIKLLVLTKMDYDTRRDSVVQKITIRTNKTFDITISLKEPAIYRLGTLKDNSIFLYLVVKPEDSIHLKIEGQKISCTGSVETQYLIDYETYRVKLFNQWLRPVYDSSEVAERTGNKEKLEYWNEQYPIAVEQYKSELSAWVEQPFFINSLAAIHHSLRWNPDKDIGLMDAMLAGYKKNYRGYLLTRQLENKVILAKRIALGAVAPAFKSTTIDGKIFEFSSVKSNYILLDFWASWCSPCRRESPTLVKVYNEYKEKGLTIVSVSIDDEKKKWIKAVEKDNYTWINVSDLQGWKSETGNLYGVSSIPASFLLDAEGRIIAKNLRGKKLEDKLHELMQK